MLNVPDSEVLAHEGWPIQGVSWLSQELKTTFGCAKMEYMIIFDIKTGQALASSSYFFTLEAEANSYRFSAKNLLLKKLAFKIIFFNSKSFYPLFYIFFRLGRHVIKKFIYQNLNFEGFD